MKAKQENTIFQCTMVSSGTVCGTAIMLGLYVAVILSVLALDDVSSTVALVAISPVTVFALFVSLQLLFQAATVLIVTPNEVCLRRFGATVTAFRRNDVTSAGFFTKYNNRGQYLYIAAAQSATSDKGTLYHQIRKNANKKNEQFICVERTSKRTEAIKRLFQQFSESNDIRFPTN